jgi:hypothetical protein
MRWLLLAMLGCGDNRVPAVPDAEPDGPGSLPDAPPDTPPPGMPDLRWATSAMDSSILMMPGTFTADSCEMAEQCIGAPGTRQLLRFDAISENAGNADLIVGVPPAPGVSDARFVWSACHGHHHFNGYAQYELLDGDDVVVAGRKQAFCILDTFQRDPAQPSHGYNCANQGLTAGWGDIYTRSLPCQWLDVTELPAGTYTLRVTINPDQLLPESDATNNVYTKEVTL